MDLALKIIVALVVSTGAAIALAGFACVMAGGREDAEMAAERDRYLFDREEL